MAATPRVSVRRSLRRSAGRLSSRASLRGGARAQEGGARERPAAMAALTPVMTREQQRRGEADRPQPPPQQRRQATLGPAEGSWFDQVLTDTMSGASCTPKLQLTAGANLPRHRLPSAALPAAGQLSTAVPSCRRRPQDWQPAHGGSMFIPRSALSSHRPRRRSRCTAPSRSRRGWTQPRTPSSLPRRPCRAAHWAPGWMCVPLCRPICCGTALRTLVYLRAEQCSNVAAANLQQSVV
jgi:hypothetical protein